MKAEITETAELQRSQRKRTEVRVPYDEEIPPYGDLIQPPEETNRLARIVIGIAIGIHKELGPGLPESAYERALAIEFDERDIPYERQYRVVVHYKGREVAIVRLDFLIDARLVLEVKSAETLTRIDRRQVVRYLRILKLPLGLLINFNVAILKQGIQRVFCSEALT